MDDDPAHGRAAAARPRPALDMVADGAGARLTQLAAGVNARPLVFLAIPLLVAVLLSVGLVRVQLLTNTREMLLEPEHPVNLLNSRFETTFGIPSTIECIYKPRADAPAAGDDEEVAPMLRRAHLLQVWDIFADFTSIVVEDHGQDLPAGPFATPPSKQPPANWPNGPGVKVSLQDVCLKAVNKTGGISCFLNGCVHNELHLCSPKAPDADCGFFLVPSLFFFWVHGPPSPRNAG
jgi:hypothetical protein